MVFFFVVPLHRVTNVTNQTIKTQKNELDNETD